MAGAADEERCWVEGCRGARFGGTPECFAHLGDDARTEALSKLRPGADVDLRDTELTDTLLQQLLRGLDVAGVAIHGREVEMMHDAIRLERRRAFQ